jgi:hypothetical protein
VAIIREKHLQIFSEPARVVVHTSLSVTKRFKQCVYFDDLLLKFLLDIVSAKMYDVFYHELSAFGFACARLA